jgi:cyclopropane-fatty-acyl-phospholipid synthase
MAGKLDIMHHYDDDFNFYESILGESLAYSCGDWLLANNLEQAQNQKLAKLLAMAKVGPDTASLIDFGCGWGSLLKYAATEHPAIQKMTGITISPGQAEFCRHTTEAPRTEILEQDIFDYIKKPASGFGFDAAISIGAFEHFATPKDFQNRTHIARYRTFFEGVKKVVSGNLGLQTIVTRRNSEDLCAEQRKKVVRLWFYISKHIFPNSLTPPLDDVLEAIDGIYAVERMEINSEDYAKTLHSWSVNLDAVKAQIPTATYERFKKYFDLTQEQYEAGNLGISRFSLRPIR